MTKKKAKRPRATKRRRKSPLFLDAAREDAKMLSAFTDREIFQRVVEVVLAYWRYHQQDAFADWFESVTCVMHGTMGPFCWSRRQTRSVLILQYATEEAWTPHLSERWPWSAMRTCCGRSPITTRIHHCAYYSKYGLGAA